MPSQVGLANPQPILKGPFTYGMSEPAKGTAQQPAQKQSPTLGTQVVRASGSGPFDSAYRQNLATYAGGQFERPGGVLSFNPTAPFQGNPGGSPTDFLTQAIGGGGFSATTTTPQTPSSPAKAKPIWQQPDWQGWLKGLQNQGGLLRGY
jgi:hypothetical protein